MSVIVSALLGLAFGAVSASACSGTNHVFAAPEGRTVVVLDCGGSNEPGFPENTQVIGLNRDGSIDLGYGFSSREGSSRFDDPERATAAEMDAEGRLLLAVGKWIYRLDARGKPDRTFDGDGRLDLSTLEGIGHGAQALALALGKGDRVIAGTASLDGTGEPKLFVLTGDGHPDPSFNEGDPVLMREAFPAADLDQRFADGLAATPEGSVLVGVRLGEELGLARLTPSGQPDPSFGTGGVIQPIPAVPEGNVIHPTWSLRSILPRPDGSSGLVVRSSTSVGGKYQSTVNTGVIGPTGEMAGFLGLQALGSANNQYVSDAALSGDRTYIAVQDDDPYEYHRPMLVTRLSAEGVADSGFGEQGLFSLELWEDADAQGIAPTPAGGAVILASRYDAFHARFTDVNPVVVRIDEQGNLDQTFGECGIVTIPELPADDPALSDPAFGDCAVDTRARPELTARASRRGRGLNLVAKIRPSKELNWRDLSRRRTALRLPSKLRLRPGALRRVRVFGGYGAKAPVIARRDLRLRARTLTIRHAPVEDGDDLRIEFGPRAFRKIPRKVRGKRLVLTATYYWSEESPGVFTGPLADTARFRMPGAGRG